MMICSNMYKHEHVSYVCKQGGDDQTDRDIMTSI